MGAGGALILGAGALALVKWAKSRGTSKPSGGQAPIAAGRVAIDASLAKAALSPIGVSTATLNVGARDAQTKQINTALLQVLQTTSQVVSSVTGAGLADILLTTIASLGAAVSIVAIAVVILVAMSSIFGQLVDERQRMQTAVASITSSYYTMNTWEFRTVKSWLDSMKVPYTVIAVDDYRLDATFYADRQEFTRRNQRYALTNVQMPAADWQKLQLLARVSCIDYMRKVAYYGKYYAVNWNLAYGMEVPPLYPGAPPPAPVAAWVDDTRQLEGPGDPSPADGVWNHFPLVGDATPFPVEALATGIPSFFTPNKLAPSWNDAVGALGNPTLWDKLQRNNQFMAIMAAMMLCRLDPRSTSASEGPQYAAHMYVSLGLRPEKDHVTFAPNDPSKLWFKSDYWGWTIMVEPLKFKMRQSGGIAFYDSAGQPVDYANGWV